MEITFATKQKIIPWEIMLLRKAFCSLCFVLLSWDPARKLFTSREVHQDDSVMLRLEMHELLNFKYFHDLIFKIIIIIINFLGNLGVHSLYHWKAFNKYECTKVVSYFSDLWCKGHLKFNKFAKKLILIVRLLCSMQGDDEIWGGGWSHKTINFGGKLSFILSFLFFLSADTTEREGIGGERRPKDRVKGNFRPPYDFCTGVCRARNPWHQW